MICLAASNRFRLTPRLDAATKGDETKMALAALQRSIVAEAFSAVLIVELAVWLARFNRPLCCKGAGSARRLRSSRPTKNLPKAQLGRCLNGTMLFSGGLPNLARSVGIHECYREAYNEIGPNRTPQ